MRGISSRTGVVYLEVVLVLAALIVPFVQVHTELIKQYRNKLDKLGTSHDEPREVYDGEKLAEGESEVSPVDTGS